VTARWQSYGTLTLREILREFGYSEEVLRKDHLTMSRTLREHGEILKEVAKRRIPPYRLLDWVLNAIH